MKALTLVAALAVLLFAGNAMAYYAVSGPCAVVSGYLVCSS